MKPISRQIVWQPLVAYHAVCKKTLTTCQRIVYICIPIVFVIYKYVKENTMRISKKCQYALKAVFELAWRNQGGPVKTQKIVEAQHVSPRFMEIILNELKHGGFVESRRGNDGGYMLVRDVREMTVREIIEYIEGPFAVVNNNDDTASTGHEAFTKFWQEVNNAIGEVCENKSFADLVDLERAKRDGCVLNYST